MKNRIIVGALLAALTPVALLLQQVSARVAWNAYDLFITTGVQRLMTFILGPDYSAGDPPVRHIDWLSYGTLDFGWLDFSSPHWIQLVIANALGAYVPLLVALPFTWLYARWRDAREPAYYT